MFELWSSYTLTRTNGITLPTEPTTWSANITVVNVSLLKNLHLTARLAVVLFNIYVRVNIYKNEISYGLLWIASSFEHPNILWASFIFVAISDASDIPYA